jgi:hypothetical protein
MSFGQIFIIVCTNRGVKNVTRTRNNKTFRSSQPSS